MSLFCRDVTICGWVSLIEVLALFAAQESGCVTISHFMLFPVKLKVSLWQPHTLAADRCRITVHKNNNENWSQSWAIPYFQHAFNSWGNRCLSSLFKAFCQTVHSLFSSFDFILISFITLVPLSLPDWMSDPLKLHYIFPHPGGLYQQNFKKQSLNDLFWI